MTDKSLPEDVLDRARQYRGAGDERAWEMADWISGVVNGNTRSRGDRTRALKQLAQAMGVSRATTSDLCQLAETYAPARKIFKVENGVVTGEYEIEPGVREEFAATLTVGHYREAMRCKTSAPTTLLAQAVASEPEWGGQPMPVDVLRAIVRKHNANIEPVKGPKELYAMYLDRAIKALADAHEYAPKDHQKSLTSMQAWLAGVTV